MNRSNNLNDSQHCIDVRGNENGEGSVVERLFIQLACTSCDLNQCLKANALSYSLKCVNVDMHKQERELPIPSSLHSVILRRIPH